MGFGLVRFFFKGVKVDDNKVKDLIRAQNNFYPFYEEHFSQIMEAVHLAKVEGFGFFDDVQIGDTHAWYRMADHYNINGFDDTSTMDRVVEAAQHIYRLSLERTDIVDFDDMVLFPLVKNIRVRFGRDLIINDEAQDSSRARFALIKKFLKRDGRLVVVGDDRQSIQGFAGAMPDALDNMVTDLKATVLPLTMTWRCPRKVVELAQQIVPDIAAAEGAAEGVISNMVPEAWRAVLQTRLAKEQEALPVADGADGTVSTVDELPFEFRPTDAILCRTNAPLVETAYALIRRGVACKVEGREIGTGLIKMIDRWKRITTITAFLDKLQDWRERETQKAIAKGKDSKVDEINDRADTLVAICDAVRARKLHSLEDVRAFIRDLFADNVTGVLTLCSQHRSKGREWPRVFILDFAKRRYSKYDTQPWQIRQADNLAYVAITRAKEELVFVNRD
jgi:superfamily I DNA/RNA helicase